MRRTPAEGIEIDVLHATHCGANNASGADSLSSSDPEVAIISLGDDNKHHHPHRSTLQRLAEQGVRIDLTNPGTTGRKTPEDPRRPQPIAHRDLLITTDGASYEVSTRRSFTADGP